MLLILFAAVAIIGSAVMALLVVLIGRPIVGASLRFSSAYKAAFFAYVVLVLLGLALHIAGVRMFRVVGSPLGSLGLLVLNVMLLAAFLAYMGRTADGEMIGYRSALVTALVASVIGFAIGWFASRSHWPSSSVVSTKASSKTSEQTFELPPGSQICLRNLALMLSDTGSGPQPGAARELQAQLEKSAREKSITMEEALKAELKKVGAQLPRGCEHLK